MKAIAVLLLLLGCVAYATAATWCVELFDAYQQGWRNANLTVIVNGAVVLDEITLYSGLSQNYYFTVTQGDQITTVFNEGIQSDVIAYRIYDQNMSLICEQGGNYTVPNSIVEPILAEVLTDVIQIGFSSIPGPLPQITGFCECNSQCIYFPSELNVASGLTMITKIQYQVTDATHGLLGLPWRVYMGNVTRSTFSAWDDWEPLANLTQVANLVVDVPTHGGWTEIELDQPFVYDSNYHLMISILSVNQDWDGIENTFCNSPTPGAQRSMYAERGIGEFDFPWPGIRTSSIPNIKIEFSNCIQLPHTESIADARFPSHWSQFYPESIGSNRWQTWGGNSAGGSPCELYAGWTYGIGETRLISAPINTTNMSRVSLSFRHLFDDYSAGLTAKVQYSHDMVNWTDAGWQIQSGYGDIAGTVNIDVPTNSNAITYIGWTLAGDHYGFDYWFLDDLVFEPYYSWFLPPNIVLAADPGVLEWEPVTNASGYRIYRSDNPYSGFYQYDFTPNTSWTDQASPAYRFFYKVTTVFP